MGHLWPPLFRLLSLFPVTEAPVHLSFTPVDQLVGVELHKGGLYTLHWDSNLKDLDPESPSLTTRPGLL